MSEKIGIRNLLTMQPNTIIWDTAVKGFNARRQRGDAVTLSVFYRTIDGQQRWHRVGRFGVWTPEQARKEAQRVLQARDLGEDPSGARMAVRQSPTVAELCDEYLSDMEAHRISGKKASTIYGDKSRIKNHIAPKIGKLKVATVTQADMETFMRGLLPGSAKRVVGLTGAIFTYAIKKKLRETNPCRGIDMPKDRKRLRRLSVDEYAQLGRLLALLWQIYSRRVRRVRLQWGHRYGGARARMASTARRIAGSVGLGGPWRILFPPLASARRRLCR